MTDGLTGLLNRRAFDAALAAELERCHAVDGGLSLLLVDVDHFKASNDSYGHTAGDGCLKQVAGAVRAIARRLGDCAARYGGEEMAVILPQASREVALLIAHELRNRVLELDIVHPTSGKGLLTVSIGVATLCAESIAAPSSEFVTRADEALYCAKASGRDAVCYWDAAQLKLDDVRNWTKAS
ncbi:GGDEF domain-containing protein [Rhizobium sp. 18065]|uniref:GGDEF domain-containing protein n=1 Tax=Rhizobium sp. 18065 TaxID=2681411 RepID=UPI001359F4D4|nr:GGDEF domain-containing protein [Rhizobium sp. 18065]